jgi:biopolymer transport protein ExbD
MRFKRRHGDEKIELMMTPMIDIVFQLLIFFMFNLRIVAPEGDFNIKMPLGAAAEQVTQEIPLPVINVRLTAGPEGQLAGIKMGDRPLRGFNELHDHILAIVGEGGPSADAGQTEVELDCDYGLKYQFVVEAITAISGRVVGNDILPLVEKIKFAPPRKPTT